MMEIWSEAPGRICLFGEHQDYLGLPVMAAAIDRTIRVRGTRRQDGSFHVSLPDVGDSDVFEVSPDLALRHARDYIRLGARTLCRQGLLAGSGPGFDVRVVGDIPINSGTSSSSALCVAWVRFLLEISGDPRVGSAEAVARLAHQVEVVETGEPGGSMDHFASALGGVIWLDAKGVTRLPEPPGGFVLGSAQEPKATLATLSSVKAGILRAARHAGVLLPGFSLETTTLEEARPVWPHLEAREALLLRGTLDTRDLTRQGRGIFDRGQWSRLGGLLSAQHSVLAERLSLSTPSLDRLLRLARDAGACGGKLNGSGGGGCVFAYVPDDADGVVDALVQGGGLAWSVRVAPGVRGGTGEAPWRLAEEGPPQPGT